MKFLVSKTTLFLGGMVLFISLLQAGEPRKIELLHADFLEYNEAVSGKYKRLIGNVSFRHDSAYMYCDSAHFFSESNYLEAFSRVHIVQGDSLNLYGDMMKYYGDTKKVDLYNHIRLIDKTMTLTTDLLHYDMITDVASYTTGGKIVDKDDTLLSKIGNYYSNANEFFFREKVSLTNPDYVMKSDTLKYNTLTKTAYFLGPTTITGKEDSIFCKSGWYDTEKEISNFHKDAFIRTGKQEISGDSVLYNKGSGYSRIFGSISLRDTAEKIVISGDYGEHNENNDSSFVTGHAMLVQIMDDDTLFLHADTLFSLKDSVSNAILSAKKIVPEDSVRKILLAYHHVKIYKSDMQGKCDSLTYSFRDSLIRLFKKPVMWSNENQLTGDRMALQMANDKMDKLYLSGSSFIISQQDSLRFNQIKGKEMTGFFTENELKRIYVEGNGQTIYFAKDKDEKYIGVNRVEGSNIMIYIDSSKVKKINIIKSPEAVFYPVKELSYKELLFKDFFWRQKERPLKKEDIFEHDL